MNTDELQLLCSELKTLMCVCMNVCCVIDQPSVQSHSQLSDAVIGSITKKVSCTNKILNLYCPPMLVTLIKNRVKS